MQQTTISLPDDDYRALKVVAAHRGVTLRDIVRERLAPDIADGRRLLVATAAAQS